MSLGKLAGEFTALEEMPRIIFLHYWGRGKAVNLAASLQKAVATQSKSP